MSASESACRSSANRESRVICASSISRRSARFVHTIANTSAEPIGSWVEWVSAGMGCLFLCSLYLLRLLSPGRGLRAALRHCLLQLLHDPGLHAVDREADRVHDRPSR